MNKERADQIVQFTTWDWIVYIFVIGFFAIGLLSTIGSTIMLILVSQSRTSVSNPTQLVGAIIWLIIGLWGMRSYRRKYKAAKTGKTYGQLRQEIEEKKKSRKTLLS